jgi:hypothetical protein
VAAIRYVYTIRRVAAELEIDEDLLGEIAFDSLDPEHGRLWVYDLDDARCMAFTADAIDQLRELIADQDQSAPPSR